MKVSIIIPTFLDSYFIKNFSLRSVLAQTYSNYEVIIANEGENTELKNFILDLNDSRIRYFELEKCVFNNPTEKWSVGGARGRNIGLDMVTGDLIAPLDHDDIWGPTYLEDRVNFFKSNTEVEFTYSKALIITKDKVIGSYGNNDQIPHLCVVYPSKYKNLKYVESGQTAADYLLWKNFKKNEVIPIFINKVTSLYNAKHNSLEVIDNLYLSTFGVEFKKIY